MEGDEVCMSERLVLIEPTEDKVGFEGVPSFSCFDGAFGASVR